MAILNKLRDLLISSGFALKTYVFIYKIYTKIILNARSNLFWLINARIAKKLLLSYKDKKIKFTSTTAHIVTSKILTDGLDKNYNKFYEEHKEIIEKEVEAVKSAEEFRKLIADYHLLTSFFYSIGSPSDAFKRKVEEEFSKAKYYDSNAIAITTATFNKIRIDIKRKYSFEKREYQSLIREVQRADFYKVIPKIEISTSQIASFVGIASTVFFLTGFLYNKYLLAFFNIEVDKFFTIGDYLATSVDNIFLSALSVLISSVFYVNGIYTGYLRTVREYHFEQKTKRHDGFVYLLMIGVLVLTVLAWYKDIAGKHQLMSVSLFIVVMSLYHSIPIEKYFKEGTNLSISVVFVLLLSFSLSIYNKVMNERERIANSDVKILKKYIFTFDGEVGFDDSATVLLAANSDYYFFYNKTSHKPYIIPKSRIKKVEVIQP